MRFLPLILATLAITACDFTLKRSYSDSPELADPPYGWTDYCKRTPGDPACQWK